MDGENNGSKPYEQMDDLGVPLFLETPIYVSSINTGKDDLGGFPTPIFGLTPILFQGFFLVHSAGRARSTVSAVAIAERRPGHLRILATTLG